MGPLRRLVAQHRSDMAVVLFLVAIAQRFKRRNIRLVTTAIAFALLIYTAVSMAGSPERDRRGTKCLPAGCSGHACMPVRFVRWLSVCDCRLSPVRLGS